MKIQKVKLNSIKLSENNPRIIKDAKFKKLIESIKKFPKMLEIRPIVINSEREIIGGNMRFRACQEIGMEEVFVIDASELTEEEIKEFMIKDNVSFGEWNWDTLANEWDNNILNDWGMDLWVQDDKDYFDVEEDAPKLESKKSVGDDDYSAFNLVMLHENKSKLIEILNVISRQQGLEKQEDCLMYLVNNYQKS